MLLKNRLASGLLGFPLPVLIGLIVAGKAVLLLGVIPHLQAAIAPNYGIGFADDYDVLAKHLALGHGYRFFQDTAPTMMREPGYPLFLAGLFYLFGYSLSIARLANLILAFVSALTLSRLAKKLTGSELVARIAPVLFLIHPGIVLAEARGGVESLFIMLLLFFLEALYRALASGRWRDYLGAGLLLGLSATVRSTALLFPVFLLAYFMIWEPVRPSLVTMAGRVALLGTAAGLMLTPWIVRNYQLVGAFVPTATVAGVSAYAGYHICTHLTFSNTMVQVDEDAGVERGNIARAAGLQFKPMKSQYYFYFYDPHDEVTFNHLLGQNVRRHYTDDPVLFASCAAKNLFHFWFSGKTWPVTAINMVVQLPYMILASIGLFAGLRGEGRAMFAPLALFIAYTLCVYLPILAVARYSLHLAPCLALLAAVPIARWWTRGLPAAGLQR